MKITREFLIDIPGIGDLMLSGEEEAEERGKKKMLEQMLEARFGALPAWATKQLAAADTRRLGRWGVQLLTAKTLKDALK